MRLLDTPSHAGLRVLFRWSDVLFDASVAPTSPKPGLDARVAGVPVVTTVSDTPFEASLMVGRRDPEALCDALTAGAKNRQLRIRLISAGYELASSGVDEMSQAVRFDRLYHPVLAERHAGVA